MAFRRDDFAERGPLDERFRFYRNLDIWWSLVLRDEGEGEPPRRAVSLDGLPVVRHEHRGYTSLPDDERDRQSKRNFYRIIDRFGWRRDLLRQPLTAAVAPTRRRAFVLVLPDRREWVARAEWRTRRSTEPSKAPMPLVSRAMRTASV